MPAQVLERSVFSLDMPRAALPLYGNHAGADKVMNRIARRVRDAPSTPHAAARGCSRQRAVQLLQMCVLMKERPHIRFRKDSWIRRVAEILHRMVRLGAGEMPLGIVHSRGISYLPSPAYTHTLPCLRPQLEEYAIAHPTMEWASPRATMLLIDRKEDVVAPLLHEYTYQAAVTDALSVRNGVVRSQQRVAGAPLNTELARPAQFEYHASLKNGQSKTRKVGL